MTTTSSRFVREAGALPPRSPVSLARREPPRPFPPAPAPLVPTPVSVRPRLLFLSHRVPFPPHNGAALRSYNILRLLAQGYDVHALCFDRLDPATRDMPLPDRIAGLLPYATVEVFPIRQQESPLRLALDHARSLLTGRSYTWFVHDEAAAVRRTAELVRTGGFSLVHVDSLDLVRLMPMLSGLPVVCTHHNVESQLLRRRAANESSFLRRAYLRLQADRLEEVEREWTPRVRLNVVVSPQDEQELGRIAPGIRQLVVPNAVDADYFRPASPPLPESAREGLVFVGGTTWYPNRDALEWFVADILPRLRALGVNEPIRWVGRASDAERERFGSVPGLTLTGYVEDIRPHVWKARCFIAPLRVGGGTRLKLLDAWAMGMAIVATPIAAEGLAVREDENMVIAESADDFARAVARVLGDVALRQRLERGARHTAETRYGWDVIARDMLPAYQAVADEAAPLTAIAR